MIVVSDTSPVLALAGVGHLDLLQRLFGVVLVPTAVARELAPSLSLPAWIEVREISERFKVDALRERLDEGEAEALVLAVESKAERLLVDERRARSIASEMGIPHVGVLGVLLEAKQHGLLREIRPILDDLVTRVGFWIHHDLRRRVLDVAGEISGEIR